MDRRRFLQLATVGAAAGWALLERAGVFDGEDSQARGVHPDLWTILSELTVLDSHEHQEEEKDRLKRTVDFMEYLRHYALSDFITAGLSSAHVALVNNPKAAPEDKWRVLAPYWDAVKNTGYVRAGRIAARRIHGVEDISGRTVRLITDELQKNNRPGYVKQVYKEICRIEVGQVNALEPNVIYRAETDPEMFLQDISGLRLMLPYIPLERVQAETGEELGNLSSYERAVQWYFERYGVEASAVKNQCAYMRNLRFDDVPREDAERMYARWRRDRRSLVRAELKALGDYSWNYIVRTAGEHKLVVKIHTGYMAGNNSLELTQIRPGQLTTLLRRFPNVKFDLFHMGYPFEYEVCAMVKQYANAYVDLTWAPIVNPAGTIHFIKQFVSACPLTKLFAFGGDYRPVDPVYGHLWITKHVVGVALTQAYEEGLLGLEDATRAARLFLRDNVAEVFEVERRREALRKRLQG